MPSKIESTFAIVSDVVHFSVIIAILYTLRRFYKHRYCQALQKRSPLLVYLMNICFMFNLLHHITDKIAYIYGVKSPDIAAILNGEEINHPQITKLISVICYIFSLHGMAIMWIARSWIIYFNCQYGQEAQKSEWGVHLNNHYPDSLWFVQHRKDYGSKRVIYPMAITWYIIHASFQTFLLFKYPDIQKIFDLASWFIELTILVIIWNKIPLWNDMFGIKKETQWFFRVSVIALLLFIGWLVQLMILGYNLWVFMIAQFMLGTMVGIMALIPNGFIFHHPNWKHLVSEDLSAEMPEKLSEVLENEQLIERLFQHLTDEFSVELLLALIEFKQFHDLMTNDNEFIAGSNSGDTRISDSILSKISLADGIPRSVIVYENHRNGNDHIRMYLKIANDLFNKYILVGAEFEVNLSYECRQEIVHFIQEHNDLTSEDALGETEKLELFILFDKASIELYRLLRNSHRRFVTARKYY